MTKSNKILDELVANGVRAETIVEIAKLIADAEYLAARREKARKYMSHVRTRELTEKTAAKSNSALANVSKQGRYSSFLLPFLNSTSVKKKEGEYVERASADFAAFWQQYPHKVGKRAALKAFPAACKRASVDEIMAGLARYAAKTDDRPWCNPATWLNQDRWHDRPAPPVQKMETWKEKRARENYEAYQELKSYASRSDDAGESGETSGAPNGIIPFPNSSRS